MTIREDIRSGLRFVMNFLTIRNPWEILVAYLIAVLAFACVYSFFLARDFYHPYVKFEPVVQAQRVRLERTLNEAIATALDRSPDGTGVKFQRTRGAVIIRGGQETTSRQALSASYSFAMSLSRSDEQGRLFLVTIPILISPFGLKTYFRSPSVQGGGELGTVYIARDPQRPIDYEIILARRSEEQAAVAESTVTTLERVALSAEQQALAAEILDADRGFPSGLEGRFSRMLYFSAVTITTVGYGDVVPLTTAARFFAALEATMGIILLGLFINSLAFRETREGGGT